MKRVAVIGAGVIGMPCAYRLLTELSGLEVTVIADRFSPNLTSAGAAGLWDAYDLRGSSAKRVFDRCLETYGYLIRLANSPEGLRSGTATANFVFMSRDIPEALDWPEYGPHVLNYRKLTANDLEPYSKFGYKSGYSFTSVVCEPKHYLPWITEKFLAAGGKIRVGHLTSLDQVVHEFDLIVNCTGLNARWLVGDENMEPIKGQVVRVNPVQPINSVIHCCVRNGPRTYIVPGKDAVTLGGTYEVGETNLELDLEAKKAIMTTCTELDPKLQGAKVSSEWCGVRPNRQGGPRVEMDANYKNKVIHNYGHGPIGVSQHWGSAGEVLQLASGALSLPIKSRI